MESSNKREEAPVSLQLWFFLQQRAGGYAATETGASPAQAARYNRNFRISVAGVAVSLLAAQQFGGGARWLGISLWMLYFAALSFMLLTLVRYVATWDELQQRIFMASAANAFVFTVIALMLNVVLPKIGLPVLNPFELLIIPAAAFLISNLIARKQFS
jgi:hypothetical protein